MFEIDRLLIEAIRNRNSYGGEDSGGEEEAGGEEGGG